MRPCETCANCIRGGLLYRASIYGPEEYDDDHCARGHEPETATEDCEDYEPGRPMTAEEYVREAAWMYDERV